MNTGSQPQVDDNNRPAAHRRVGSACRRLALLLSAIGLAGLLSSPAEAAFGYKRSIELKSNIGAAETLSNFPVLVKITLDPSHVKSSSGFDIAFRLSDSGPNLPHEVERYIPATGELIAWVKLDTMRLNANETLAVYYGDSTIQSSQQNADAVWSNVYVGVWHLSEDGTTAYDATANKKNGTNNLVTSISDGKIGKAYNFSGLNNNRIALPSLASANWDNFTLSMWINPNMNYTGSTVGVRSLIHTDSWSSGDAHFQVPWEQAQTGGKPGVMHNGGRNWQANTAFGLSDVGKWEHLVFTFSRSGGTGTWVAYRGGSPDGSTSGTSVGVKFTATSKIGSSNWGRHLNAKLDEFRISNVTRSANWIKAEYINQNDPGAFIILGAEVALTPEVYYKITALAGDGGSISPSGTADVLAGQSRSYTVTANPGYTLASVKVDGAAVALPLSNNQYTFSNVQDDREIVASFTPVGSTVQPDPVGEVVPGCGQNSAVNYSNTSGFVASDFNLIYSRVDPATKWITLNSGALDPDNPSFFVPFTQKIKVTHFFWGSAAWASNIGWMYASDLPADKSLPHVSKLNYIHKNTKAAVGQTLYGDWPSPMICQACPGACRGWGSVALRNFDSDYAVDRTGNNIIDARDNRLVLRQNGPVDPYAKDAGVDRFPEVEFPAGTELVFWLQNACDQALQWNFGVCGSPTCDWISKNAATVDPQLYFTKKEWNQDRLTHPNSDPCKADQFDILYRLGDHALGGTCERNTGWLIADAVTAAKNLFNLDFSGQTATKYYQKNQKFQHAMAAFPLNRPNEWVIGWEDLPGGGDIDMNDHVLHIERQAGGLAQLKNPIVPASASDYITAVEVTVFDYIPACSKGAIAPMPIRYYVSVNNGASWVEITSWDEVGESNASKATGPKLASWTPGSPEHTWRKFRVDFAGLNQSGRQLLWKAEFRSADLNCNMPAIMDVKLRSDGMVSGNFSRGAPVVKANVVYSGYYQTPANSWTDKSYRGHLSATRLYDPSSPDKTDQKSLWNAGEKLAARDPGSRTIYFPDISVGQVSGLVVGTGDGETVEFTGRLDPSPILGTTLVISDGRETFKDKNTDLLEGDLGGTGTINRFTGEFSLTFSSAPFDGVPITAGYQFYTSSVNLVPFEAANVTRSLMGLNDTYLAGHGYIYDLDQNGIVDDVDAGLLMDWVKGYRLRTTAKREWLLDPIDHSVPAVVTAPGLPIWYFGTATTKQERQGFDAFIKTHAARPTVVFAGSRSGMLHAFDGGAFRHGENECTDVEENRGFFEWRENCAGDGPPVDQVGKGYGTGEELWAFIPANLLPRMKNNLLAKLNIEPSGDTSQAYVDAAPAVADVYVNGAWRTVLLSAQGNGGDTIFCLDITDPRSPKFMWEFADPDLFRSRSSPSVGKIGRLVVDGAVKWVAFFVSGADSRYDLTQWPSVYMIDVATGSVLKRVYLDREPNGKGAIPSGQPTLVDSDGNGYVDRFYIGTDKGYLYKVNLPDDPDGRKYPISQCVVNRDFTDNSSPVQAVETAWRYQPIYGSPVAVVANEVSPTGQIDSHVKVFFGTGDSPYSDEDIDMAGTRYHFFAYIDKAPKGSADDGLVELDWLYELPPGQRVFASAFAAAGSIYFGTSTADTEDPCYKGGLQSYNKGELFAFEMERKEESKEKMQPNFRLVVGNMVAPPLVEDQHIYLKVPGQGLMSLGSGVYNTEILFGGFPQMQVRTWRELW